MILLFLYELYKRVYNTKCCELAFTDFVPIRIRVSYDSHISTFFLKIIQALTTCHLVNDVSHRKRSL